MDWEQEQNERNAAIHTEKPDHRFLEAPINSIINKYDQMIEGGRLCNIYLIEYINLIKKVLY